MRSPELRIVEHRILAIDLMLYREIIRIGCGPVAFERGPYLAIFHLDLPRRVLPRHYSSLSSPSMVGMCSDTVGRMCIACCITV